MNARDVPKVDLHTHGEAFGWTLDLLARRRGYRRHDQAPYVREAARLRPGLERLAFLDAALGRGWPEGDVPPGHFVGMDDQPDHVEARYAALMEASAGHGALHIEVRVGGETVLAPHFMPCFRAAEARVRRLYPAFGAEPVVAWRAGDDTPRLEARVRRTLEAAGVGLHGVDIYPSDDPDPDEWATLYRWSASAARAGLGVTCHAGEFSPANLRRAVGLPGLTRLGHAVRAADVPGLLAELARRGTVVEVQLTSNVVLGAVSALRLHPLRRFLDAGVRVTLGSDDPLRLDTDIGREYAAAVRLGFDSDDLVAFTRTGVQAAFVTPARRAELLRLVDASATAPRPAPPPAAGTPPPSC